jgi:hypothetical protein
MPRKATCLLNSPSDGDGCVLLFAHARSDSTVTLEANRCEELWSRCVSKFSPQLLAPEHVHPVLFDYVGILEI